MRTFVLGLPFGSVLFAAVFSPTLLRISAKLVSTPASYAQTATSPKPAQTKTPPARTKPQDRKFGFRVVSVEKEPPTSTMYRVEALTDDKVRFLLSCHSVPPVELLGSEKDSAAEKLKRWFDLYGDIEKFRKAAIERVYLASEIGKYKGVILLYVPGEEEEAHSNASLDEVLDQCAVLNRIPNGDSIFPITVSSSEFRNWKDRAGYEVEAQTKDESLTLACAEGKGQACHSLPPKVYRAIRRQSQWGDLVALYDADLNLVAIYRILSEQSSK
jgi:hypothetical protein